MANRVLADLAVKISANTAEFQKSLKNSERSLLSLEKTGKTLTRTLGAVGLGLSVGALAKNIFDLGVKAEQTTVAFTTFLGSATKAKTLLAELIKFSQETPFTPDQVNSAARTLLGFGFQVEEILPSLKALGNISAGTGKDLTELSIIYGQIRTAGRLMGQDLLQLINAGFNPLQVISQKTGKSVRELRDEMAKGNITFDQVAQAFKDATSEGGLFFNLTENLSKTVGGRVSILTGNFQELGKTIFGLASGPIPALVTGLNNLVIAVNNALKITTFEQIADVSLNKFRDKLKEVENQLKSTDEETKKAGIAAADIFERDVVEAINDVNKELTEWESKLKELRDNNSRVFTQAQAKQYAKDLKEATIRVGALTAELKGLEEISNDINKAFLELGSQKDFIETLDTLNAKKKSLIETFDKTDIRNRRELASLAQQISFYDEKIKRLEKIKKIANEPENIIDSLIDPTVLAGRDFGKELQEANFQKKFIESLNAGEQVLFEGVDFEQGLDVWRQFYSDLREEGESFLSYQEVLQKQYQEKFERTGEVALAYTNILSNGIADAISGQLSFAQALARTTDGIVQEYGRQAIAAAIRNAVSAKSPFPLAQVAQAAVAVGLISGLLRRAAGFKGGGGSGGGGGGFRPSVPSSSFASVGQNIRPMAEFQIRGQDLYVVLSNYERNNRSTRNG